MPLPAATEAAAKRVAARVSRFDRDLDRYIADGGRAPSVAAVMADIRADLERAAAVAVADGAAIDVPVSVVRDAVRTQQAALQTALRDAERQARRVRREVPRRLPEQDDDETIGAFVRRVGPVVAAVVLAAVKKRPVRRNGAGNGNRATRPEPVTGPSMCRTPAKGRPTRRART